MATVINRTTKRILRSVNTPEFPISDWIIEPDLSLISDVPSQFLKITGDIVSEMTPTEKQVVMDGDLARENDSISNEIDRKSLIKALAQVLLKEINDLRAKHSLPPRTLSQLKTAIRNKL